MGQTTVAGEPPSWSFTVNLTGPCLGWAFGVQPWGLQLPKSLVLKPSSFPRCLLRLHICICPRPSHGSWPLSTSRAVFLSTSMAAGGQLQLIKGGCGTRSMGTECPAVASLEACWPGLGSVPSLRETQRETMLSESTAQGALRCSLWDPW